MTGCGGCLYLRRRPPALGDVNVYCGRGINEATGSRLGHCKVMTHSYGIAFTGPWAADVAMRYNDVGLWLYGRAHRAQLNDRAHPA